MTETTFPLHDSFIVRNENRRSVKDVVFQLDILNFRSLVPTPYETTRFPKRICEIFV